MEHGRAMAKRLLTSAGIIITLCMFLPGCLAPPKQPAPTKRYKLTHDVAPKPHEPPPDISKIPDAVPKHEPKSKIGNPKKYTVFKKSYNVMATSKGYKEQGKASWYGKKFHGYHTSNGEIYDMYGMSAAHKTLPLPTYVRVKNLENGKSIVVKVNDRGPFHEDRVIDLSYAAASKLGILAKGTCHVEIEALDPKLPTPQQYLQIAAFSKEENAKKLALDLKNAKIDHPVEIRPHHTDKNKLYLVHVGPIKDAAMVTALRKKLSLNNFPNPISVLLE